MMCFLCFNMDNDILETHGIGAGTYGVQRALDNYVFEDHLEKEKLKYQISDGDNRDALECDDLLTTNPISMAPVNPPIDSKRMTREIRELINIDSSQRQLTKGELIERHSETGTYVREIVDGETGEITLSPYTAEDLNSEHTPGDSDLQFPYEQRGEDIYYNTYLYRYPNSYSVHLSKTLSNVKSIRLVQTSVPHTIWPVNDNNNLILLDIIDNDVELSDEDLRNGVTNSVDYRNTDYPFLTVKLPEGNYTLDELITTLQSEINGTVENNTKEEFANLFTVSVNTKTEEVKITLNQPSERDLAFNLKFWEDTTQPESRFLYAMLGFKEASVRNQDGEDIYVTERSNVVDLGPSTSGYGYRQQRPFRKIDLAPTRYIYFGLEGYPSMIDTEKRVDFMAKVILKGEPGGVENDTFVQNAIIFDNPIPELTTLKIRWYNPGDSHSLVDFGLRDHSLTLEIVRYVDNLEDNRLGTHRGAVDHTSYSKAVLTDMK